MSTEARGLEARVRTRVGTLELDVDFEVPPGRIVGLLGPNGAGKTTLLRVLAGLLIPDEGRVVLDGRVLDDRATGEHVPAEDRPVGVVFQSYVLFPHLTALENVAFGLRSRGVAKGPARVKAGQWLDRVGLGAYKGSKPKQLSGGQGQRVALARAMATEPRLLLLDEPLAALDASTRLETRRELRRHLEGYDGVRLLVTHDPVEAIAMAERLIVLEDGRISQIGTPQEISEQPRSRYVADLVGVNLYRGRAEGDEIHVGAAGHLVVPGAGHGEVFAVVHPHSVSLYREPPGGTPRNIWVGTVEALDLEGERVRVRIGGSLPIVAEVTPAAVADLRLGDGGTIWASVKATGVVVYPV
ncbi:MAG TPA: ABC transporter ATP-binding protein [Acidimicrobiia bacterium]|nr:ABC transporter ATP-binding protein [Acidimicrobiia bacterium]